VALFFEIVVFNRIGPFVFIVFNGGLRCHPQTLLLVNLYADSIRE
jgi:hypothetical protein